MIWNCSSKGFPRVNQDLHLCRNIGGLPPAMSEDTSFKTKRRQCQPIPSPGLQIQLRWKSQKPIDCNSLHFCSLGQNRCCSVLIYFLETSSSLPFIQTLPSFCSPLLKTHGLAPHNDFLVGAWVGLDKHMFLIWHILHVDIRQNSGFSNLSLLFPCLLWPFWVQPWWALLKVNFIIKGEGREPEIQKPSWSLDLHVQSSI